MVGHGLPTTVRRRECVGRGGSSEEATIEESMLPQLLLGLGLAGWGWSVGVCAGGFGVGGLRESVVRCAFGFGVGGLGLVGRGWGSRLGGVDLVLSWPSFGLCAPILELCWPILGL